MSSEQEAAANWRSIEDYQAVKKRLEALQSQLRTWGENLSAIGKDILADPAALTARDAERLVAPEEFRALLADWSKTRERFGRLRASLKNLGIEPF